ncbi:MAG TPA: hypothetical protein VKA17_04450 [Gammaproteobacteria bacterium]|nr:hypothetical protein [Gammaproteobacteria bacterium]HKK03155.1 hypothetical protein [Gammaproteobacteria bacterium]
MTELSRQQKAVEKLRQERDELRLQVHLGRAELQEEWQALEHKWETLEARLADAAGEAREASQDIGAAIGVLTDELGHAYRRIRDKLR